MLLPCPNSFATGRASTRTQVPLVAQNATNGTFVHT